MTSIRRIYAYLLTFAGLAILSIATANLGQLLIDVVFRPAPAAIAAAVRDSVAQYAAAALVGLIAWLVHWTWIARTARGDPAERASTLRRLFMYAVLAAGALVLAGSLYESLQGALDALVGSLNATPSAREILRPLPFALIAAIVWLAHWRVASADRRLVGERGGSATLRRWYVFGLALIGFVVLLVGLAGFVETIWRAFSGAASFGPALTSTAATAAIGLGLWASHWRALPRRLPRDALAEDGTSVLRSVYLFLALSAAIVGTLYGASQLLYYAMGRLLGVDRPGGVSGDLLQAAAGPASIVLVYGAAWLYQRLAVAQQARAFEEAPRQVGIRRLYTYVVALAGLYVLALGMAGLLWTLADITLSSANSVTWREQVSLFATLAIVGLPVWFLHWRVNVDAEEAHSLARRLYLYLGLIVAALALIGSAAAALYKLIGLTLGASLSTSLLLDLTHALAIAVVGATVVIYHWRFVRAESARPVTAAEPPAAPTEATVRIQADDPLTLSRALDALRATGVRVSVV